RGGTRPPTSPEPVEEPPVAPPVPVPAGASLAPAAAPRPVLPAPLPAAPQSRYLQHLPTVYEDNVFLGRYLLIFESLWEPLEQRQDHVDMYFDPRTCPAAFLPWLARWLDLSFNTHSPEA